MKKIFLLYIIFINLIFAGEKYIPKSRGEIIYLNELRKKEITLGISNAEFAERKIGGISLNDILIDIFKNYLQLNIKIKKDSWTNLYKDLKNKDIDIIGIITRNEERKKICNFTIGLYGENLYIASKNENIDNIKELKNRSILVEKNSLYIKYLKEFLKNNDIRMSIIGVDKIEYLKDQFILESATNLKEVESKLSIGHLPDTSIGVSKEYKGLINILNNSINEKYSLVIENYIHKKNREDNIRKFNEKLTTKEKKYLKNLKEITIAYENRNNISYFSKKDKVYRGAIPSLMDKIGNRLGIKVNVINSNNMTWEEMLSSFESSKIMVLPLTKTSHRKKDYIFVDDIYNVDVYWVTDIRSKNDNKIGVVKNTIDEEIAKKYFFNEQLTKYDTYNDLYGALKNRKINSAILFDIDDLDEKFFNFETMEKIPINLALHKNDVILKDILNKAIKMLVNKNEILKDSGIRERRELLEKIEFEKNQKNKLIFFLGCILIFSIIITYKCIKNRKKAVKLLVDPLTGLLSRTVFDEFCKKKNYLEGNAVLIDLDNFKNSNDIFGHSIGDEILKNVSIHLKNIFKNDYIFRISGDEFYIFNIFDLEKKLKKLEIDLKMDQFLINYRISLSIGCFKKTKEMSLKESFKYADFSMYEAKLIEGHSIYKGTKEFICKKKREQNIRLNLKKLKKEDIYVAYQPKILLENRNKVIGVEALARWKNSEFGYISPGEFIPIAEKIKHIHYIDYRVAEISMKTLKEWFNKEVIDKDFKLSFNLSMLTFERDDCVEIISKMMEKYGILGENLEIEITESLLVSNMKLTLEKMKIFKELGVTFSLDDFTTGHSTASVLPILPIDIVKFDKSLIESCNEKNGKIVYNVLVNLIKGLKLKIVAEGIETEKEYKFLKGRKVDYGQGYLFSKPLWKNDFEKYKKKNDLLGRKNAVIKI